MEPGLNKEINTLRGDLSSLNSQKHEKFKVKDELSKKIVGLITDVKKLRIERDALTDEVKKLKEKRSELNKELNGMVSAIKEVNKEKKATQKKLGIKKDPTQLKKEIDKLDEKVETEVLSFDQEQRIMKQIKELKKTYSASHSASKLWDSSNEKSKEIKQKRLAADEVHKLIQQKAKESQSNMKKSWRIAKQLIFLRLMRKKQ